MKKKSKIQNGFTLIELIIYIALVSIFITGTIFFAWDVVYGREKTYQQQIVEQNGRSALARISYETRRAKNIQSVSANQIVLNNEDSTTTIALSEGVIQITIGDVGPYNLTSNEVEVINLTFLNLTSPDNNTKNIKATLTAKQSQAILSGQIPAQVTMSTSIELNGQFNAGRALLMNASDASLSGNKSVINTTLENSGTTDIVIDKITVSWVGGTSDSQLKDIRINDFTVWSGSAFSGDILDITNTTLVTDAAAIPIDRFNFSKSMVGAVVTIVFTMTDGSTMSVIIDFS